MDVICAPTTPPKSSPPVCPAHPCASRLRLLVNLRVLAAHSQHGCRGPMQAASGHDGRAVAPEHDVCCALQLPGSPGAAAATAGRCGRAALTHVSRQCTMDKGENLLGPGVPCFPDIHKAQIGPKCGLPPNSSPEVGARRRREPNLRIGPRCKQPLRPERQALEEDPPETQEYIINIKRLRGNFEPAQTGMPAGRAVSCQLERRPAKKPTGAARRTSTKVGPVSTEFDQA